MGNNTFTPRISVIIAVYNAAPFLRECLDSLCTQTFDNWELICVDDGSTDDSLSILQQYIEKLPHMTILTQENQGAGLARNHGMDAATGKYLLFLDADDYFSPDLLEKMWQGAENSHADVTICRSQCFDHASGNLLPSEWLRKDAYLNEKTTFSPQEVAPYLFQFTYGWAWDKLFLREFVLKSNFRFPVLKNSEDLVFVFPALASAKIISVVPDILVNYRMKRTTSVSHSRVKAAQAPWQAMELLENHLEQTDLYPIYEQTFLNWAMEFLVWNVANMPNAAVQKEEFYRVKKEFLSHYQFEKYPLSYYTSKSSYAKYILLKHTNYFVFLQAIRLYKKLKSIREAL